MTKDNNDKIHFQSGDEPKTKNKSFCPNWVNMLLFGSLANDSWSVWMKG